MWISQQQKLFKQKNVHSQRRGLSPDSKWPNVNERPNTNDTVLQLEAASE